MRTLSALDEQRLFAADRDVRLRVRIANAAGTMVDYTVDGGSLVDWVNSVTVSANVDEMVMGATIEFFREVDGDTLSPYMAPGAEAIKAGRAVTIEAAVVLFGESVSESDYWMLFEGFVDDWQTGRSQSTIALTCRDPLGLYQDVWTIAENTYGSNITPVPVETIMQSLIDERFSGDTFETDGDPDFGIIQYTQAMQSILDAVKANVDLIGWLFRRAWSDSLGAFRTLFSEPDRLQATPVFTISPSDYYDLPSFSESSMEIRNEVVGKWGGGKVTAVDQNSIDEYGRTKTMVLNFTQDAQLNTEARVLALVTAVVSDLAQPLAKQEAITPLFPPVEVNDFYRFTPDSILYSEAQDMAVTSFDHYIGPDGSRTTMRLRGKPTGGVTRWDTLRDRLEETIVEEEEDVELTADDVQYLYTTRYASEGGAIASTEAESLGAWASSTEVGGGLNDAFRAVTQIERDAGITLYRAFFAANVDASPIPQDWECVVGWLPAEDSDGIHWSIALDPTGIVQNDSPYIQGIQTSNEQTEPTSSPSLAWVFPQALDDPDRLDPGTVPAGFGFMFWVRLIVDPGATGPITDEFVTFANRVPSGISA